MEVAVTIERDEKQPVRPRRELSDHKLHGKHAVSIIHVMDDPGPGGACHEYRIQPAAGDQIGEAQTVRFQNGGIAEVGANGVQHEDLLAIIIDRMRSFQEGPYSCRDNAIALTHMEEALLWLKKRTAERLVRGVEGKVAA